MLPTAQIVTALSRLTTRGNRAMSHLNRFTFSTQPLQPILAIILSIAGIFALLVAGNRRNGERYQQWWSPPAAVLLLLYVLYEYHSSRPEILDSLRQVGYLDYAELVVSLLAIILFALAKMGINAASGRFGAPPADNVAVVGAVFFDSL